MTYTIEIKNEVKNEVKNKIKHNEASEIEPKFPGKLE